MLAIASDHGGLGLKNIIGEWLAQRGIDYEDMGTFNEESVDYPDYGVLVAKAVLEGRAERGILVCGTGIGMSIVANKFPGIRAALVHDEFTAKMAGEHNNANILVLGGRVLEASHACELVQIWLNTPFAGGRHQRRLDKIAALEEE
ncbi:MAG: ribose 5-phosphate isomerase B, partial [Deltaproteobacteria bacterium]|nr:ribose 5-phosphate isomerase B [Deltaproteobacteria bacterium]